MPTRQLQEREYYKIDPREILHDILDPTAKKRLVEVRGVEFFCCPHVYPSERFRTTNFLLETVAPFLKHSTVCDMGCGPGIVGLFAVNQGAKKVVQCDINPYAVENAIENRTYHEILSRELEVYESDCFDGIPQQTFDVIIFNPPFHSDLIDIKDPLEHAFFDPNFKTVQKFLKQAEQYSNDQTKIFIAFSNKGDIRSLEGIFQLSSFEWEIWSQINQDKEFDNRIYMLWKKQ
ncbi:MAG: methyltransferase [Chlamydiia bacterium]|nr:methyltransferase [Chlamydiia bacterium]